MKRRYSSRVQTYLSVFIVTSFCNFAAAQDYDQGTVKFTEFNKITMKGDFSGCQITFKILAPDHTHNVGRYVAITLNFSSYFFPDKPFNFKMKVCGWDASLKKETGVEFTQFDVDYAFLLTDNSSWAKK